MKEHVVRGLYNFNIMTDNYVPGMAPSDDVTILSAEYVPDTRMLRIYIPVHAGKTWDLADFVKKVVLDYKDENTDAVASYRLTTHEEWDGPNNMAPDPSTHSGYCALRRRCYINIWFSGTVDTAQLHVEEFRTFLTDILMKYSPNFS